MFKVNDIRVHFINQLTNQQFTTDKTGQKTIEMIGASFIADEPAIFGIPNEEYIAKEIAWYESESTNIYDINNGNSTDAPAAWKYSADKHGNINSNYGHLVFSEKYFSQYYQAIVELTKNSDSRRAQMVYNRPSIWVEYDEGGKSDFICTNAQTFYIRDNKLHMVSQMRSNDVVYGYKNDYAWAKHLMNRAVKDLRLMNPSLEIGDLIWQVMNLHVYEKHFGLVK